MAFPLRCLLPAAPRLLLRELMSGLRGGAARHLGCLLVVAWLSPGLAAAAELTTVRVGVGSNPPIAFQDSAGEMQGIAVDVLNDVAGKEGWRLDFVHAEWQQLLDLLEQGEIDLLTGIAYTPERAERFEFTRETVLGNWGVVYARPGSKIQSLFELQDRRVALIAGATHSDELSELVARFGVRIVPTSAVDYDQALAMVASGDADAAVVSRVFGTLNSARYHLESTGIVFNPISVHYAAPKDADPAIIRSVDRHLEDLLARRDSAYYESLDRWLGDVTPARLPEWVRWALMATLSTLALAMFFVLSLRRQVRVRTLALRDSEESFRATFNQAAVGIAQVELDGRWREVNQRLCDIVGYTRDELLQLTFQDLTHPEDLGADLEQVRQMLAGTQKTYALEKRYLHKSGATVWIRLTVALVRGESEGPKYFVSAIEDITARKLAEAALFESEARSRLFIDHAPAALAMLDHEMRYLAVSRRWLKDYGLDDCELLGRSHYEIFPEISEAWKDVHRRGLAGEVVRADEERFVRYDGTAQWLRWEVRPWYTSDGAVGGIVIFSEDITERKEAEGKARQGELVLDSVFQALPDLFFLMDPDGTIRDYRAQQSADLYVPPKAFLGRRMQDVFRGDIGQLVQRKMVEIGERGGLATCEYDLTVSGDARRFEARLTRLPKGGQFIAVVRDITREYQDRRLLAGSEARYRRLFEHNPAPMLVYERGSLRLLAVNEAFTSHYGYRPDEVPGMRLPDLYPEAEKQRLIDCEARLAGLVDVGEWRHIKKNGSLIDVEARSHDLCYEGQAIRLAVITDITGRKRMQDEISQLNAELEQRVRQRTVELENLNRELQTFTYSVSHDLKAPLRGIDGYSRLLLDQHREQLDDEGRLFLVNVRNGVAQMSRLIEDLLAYSRMERRSLHVQSIDLAAQVSAVLAPRSADIQARGVLVEVALQGLTAHADPEGLGTVLRNLLDNALKFARDSRPPAVTINAVATDASIILSIKDNGIGFDMRFHDRIFAIFQRLQRAEDFPGTGVGLAIVHKAVQRMAGRVWAESAPGQGATFYVELPR